MFEITSKMNIYCWRYFMMDRSCSWVEKAMPFRASCCIAYVSDSTISKSLWMISVLKTALTWSMFGDARIFEMTRHAWRRTY